LPNAKRRPAVNVFPAKTAGDPDGGYPAACAATRSTSPLSLPAAIDTVNVPDDACAVTVAVFADVADADPALFDAVTTTCTVEPTSAAANTYVA
jgi:hypothetical protein